MPNLLDNRRFTVDNGTGTTTVTPVNRGLRYRWAVEGDGRFYRKRLSTKLVFKGGDYDFIKGMYDDATCAEVSILIERTCDRGATWATEYEGRLLIFDASYDLDGCRVECSILPNDLYECVNRGLKVPKNWLDYGSRVTVQTILGSVETTSCTYNGAEFGSNSIRMFLRDCWDGGTQSITTGFTPDATEKWRPILHRQVFDLPTSGQMEIVTDWNRETINYPGGPPPGTGWINTTGDTWVRPIMYGQILKDTFKSPPEQERYDFQATVADVEISNGRLLSDVLEGLVTAMDCDILEVRSDFFGINPPATAPSNEAYDWAADFAQTMVIFQKSDVSRASADEDAIRLTLNLGDLLRALQDSLNVYWAIEYDGTDAIFRVEHWSYFEGNNGTDLTTLGGGIYIAGTNQFEAQDSVPANEAFKYQESYTDSFLEKQIQYPFGCSDSDKSIQYQQAQMCADVGGLLDNDSAGLDGFVLVSASFISGIDYLIDSTNYEANGCMAWRETFQPLWSYGRFMSDGVTTTAGAFTVNTVRQRKQQAKITFPWCCTDGEFNAAELVQTGLGWGQVFDAEEDTEKQTMTVTLKH